MADCPYCKPLKPPGPYDEAARKRASDGVAAFDATRDDWLTRALRARANTKGE